MTNNGLVNIIESNHSWPELVASLKSSGYRIPKGRKRIVKKVSKLWSEAIKDKEIEYDEWNNGLPGSVARRDGRSYVIHGVIHDSQEVKLDKQYKNMIKEESSGMDNLLYEHGFGDYFGLESGKEIEDLTYLLAKLFPRRKEQKRLILLMTVGLATYPLIMSYNLLKKSFLSLHPAVRKAKNVKTLEDFKEQRKYFMDRMLPQPLGFRAMRYIKGENSETSLANIFLNLRSLAQAKEIDSYAEEKNANEVHALVGIMHEPQIKYFLENPKELEKLEDNPIYQRGQDIINGFF